MPRYITVTRPDTGTSYKRRVMTAAEKKAWKKNLSTSIRAAKQGNKKQGNKRSNGHAAEPKTAAASAPTNGAMHEHAAAATPDDAAIRAARRIEAALVCLKHGADWLEQHGPKVADFDTAHRQLLEARATLLGR